MSNLLQSLTPEELENIRKTVSANNALAGRITVLIWKLQTIRTSIRNGERFYTQEELKEVRKEIDFMVNELS